MKERRAYQIVPLLRKIKSMQHRVCWMLCFVAIAAVSGLGWLSFHYSTESPIKSTTSLGKDQILGASVRSFGADQAAMAAQLNQERRKETSAGLTTGSPDRHETGAEKVVHMRARDASGSPIPRPNDALAHLIREPQRLPLKLSGGASQYMPGFANERHDADALESAFQAAPDWPELLPATAVSNLWSEQDPASCIGYFASGFTIRDIVLGPHLAPRPHAVQSYIRSARFMGGMQWHAVDEGMSEKELDNFRNPHDAQQLQAHVLRGGHQNAMQDAAAQEAAGATKSGPPLECRHNPRHPSSYCVLRHAALRLNLIKVAQGNESLSDVLGRPDADELPVYSKGAVQVLVHGKDGKAVPHLHAAKRTSTPLTDSQQHAYSKVCIVLPVGTENLEPVHASHAAPVPQHDFAQVRGLNHDLLDSVTTTELLPQCTVYFPGTTVLISRVEYANWFHATTELYSVFSVAKALGLQGPPRIILADGHCHSECHELPCTRNECTV
jgi:hypothetical protein